MSLVTEMMGGGLSSGAARAINGNINSTVAAAGTTIADATELKAGHNIVTTVAAGSGVRPVNSEISDEMFVYNATGTEALTIYPPTSSGTINQLTAGTGMLLAPYTGVKLKKATATAWTAFLSA